MAEKKLKYREVPQALAYVVRTIWGISRTYVVITLIQQLKNRLVPYSTLFIAAAVTTKLPEAINNGDVFWEIAQLSVLAFCIETASRAFDLLTNRTYARAETHVSIVMREYFYGQYAKLPYHLYEDKDVIDAFNYADDFMYRFGQFGINQIARTMGGALDFVIATFALAAVAWYMPLLLLVFIPFLLRSIFLINRENVRSYKDNQPNNRRIWTIERMFYPRFIKETRLYGVVEYFLRERSRLMEKVARAEQRVAFRRDKLNFIQDIELNFAELVASLIAVWRIAFQGAPLGIFVLAQQLTSRAGAAIDGLFSDLTKFDEDLYGFSEYRYITEELQQPDGDQNKAIVPSNPHIRMQELSFTYPDSSEPALRSITLDIPYGTSLAIVGENGAGKTTMTKLLLGLYVPSAGAILINDQSMQSYSEASWLAKSGILLQDFGMNEDITIRDAVRVGNIDKPLDDTAIWEALEGAELKTAIEKLPHKLDSYLGKWIDEEKGTELSGGQLQRLAIARTLYRDPEILILDEPTSAIDANAEERIFSKLAAMREGKTTIFISHRFSTVRRAQRIAFIHKGKLVEFGTHEELMKLRGRYYEMFTKQAEGYK